MAFREQYGPWAIVAGASEGTGASFARQLAARGLSLILVALDGPLDEVAEQARSHGVEVVTARIDLSQPEAVDRIAEVAGDREIGLYVANAGGDANASRYLDKDVKAWVALAHVNILTTMQAAHYFGRRMRARGRGGLLIVNSGGCYGGGSFLVTYNSCKAFLLNFAEGLWAELRPHGVDVLSINCGMMDTPNFHRILARTGMSVALDELASPDAVAAVALERLQLGPVHIWGLAVVERCYAVTSAADRRERVLALDAATARMYGE
jgi:short-subunit dehydrogenase